MRDQDIYSPSSAEGSSAQGMDSQAFRAAPGTSSQEEPIGHSANWDGDFS